MHTTQKSKVKLFYTTGQRNIFYCSGCNNNGKQTAANFPCTHHTVIK